MAMWDCGSTGLNAIVTTFVFSVYLDQRRGLARRWHLTGELVGSCGAVAGLTIGRWRPVVAWVESPHRRRALSARPVPRSLTCAMFLIRRRPPLPVGRG